MSTKKERPNPFDEAIIQQRYDTGKFLEFVANKDGVPVPNYKGVKAGQLGSLSANGAVRRLNSLDKATGQLAHPGLIYNISNMIAGTYDVVRTALINSGVPESDVDADLDNPATTVSIDNAADNEYLASQRLAASQNAKAARQRSRERSPMAQAKSAGGSKAEVFQTAAANFIAEREARLSQIENLRARVTAMHDAVKGTTTATKSAGGRRASPRSQNLFDRLARLDAGVILSVSERDGKITIRKATRPNENSLAGRTYPVPGIDNLFVTSADVLRRVMTDNGYDGNVEELVAAFNEASRDLYERRLAAEAQKKTRTPRASKKAASPAASPRTRRPLTNPASPARSPSPARSASPAAAPAARARFGRRA